MRLTARSVTRASVLAVAVALAAPQVGVASATAAPQVGAPAAVTSVTPVKAAAAKKVVRYTKTKVNVRKGPGTKYRVVGAYAKGRKLTGTLTKNGWLRTAAGKYVAPSVLTAKAPAKKAATAKKAPAKLTPSRILAQAAKYKGIMYRAGGSTTSGFDCSGYTRYVFAKLGKSLPRTVAGQKARTTRVSKPRAGDLVFWGNYHVAIYAGNGMIWDSGRPGLPVQKRKMFSGVTSYGRVG
ncbi:MAG TPA: NlpC/P60 family protein [Ornithinicoccus sp.]|jgi:cell wall-associated NlpC family hydrolase|nr:NlpC/P60 family protein [Ornithinicoccus sp.]